MAQSLAFLSIEIEQALVARNLRGMAGIRDILAPGYCLRAAQTLLGAKGVVLIGTGFPVNSTFETDGPIGAIALYQTLETLGLTPYIVCGKPLSTALSLHYRVVSLLVGSGHNHEDEAQRILAHLKPNVVVSIERPGKTSDGRYYNMRGEDISARTACFDTFLDLANCPTIAIGDGGNEIGMGNVRQVLQHWDIEAAVTECDELIVADVSNWGSYGLIALMSRIEGKDFLQAFDPVSTLGYLSTLGSVDGVTRLNALTEDGLSSSVGAEVILELRRLAGFLG